MKPMQPNLDWYKQISKANKLLPRCPFASAHRCPRFYQSLSLLGEAGSTKISLDEDEKLKKRWGKSDLWPTTLEQATAIWGPEGSPKHFINFCPEASFERFGLFASHLHEYADEIDHDMAHAELGNNGASGDDWRWSWQSIIPMHYTDCPLYSPLQGNRGIKGSDETRAERWYKKIKSHPVVSFLIFVGLVVISLANFTDAFQKLFSILLSLIGK